MCKTTNRVLELDLMKTFIIIVSMIGIHTMYDLTALSAEDGALEYVLNILATQFGAPVFMFCMGMTLGFSHHQEPGNFLRRGIRLITIGMILNVLRYIPTAYSSFKAGDVNIFSGWAQIFNVDILQFAGLAFMLLALLRKLNVGRYGILALGLCLNVAGTLLDGYYTDSYVVNQVLGYFYPTPTCCCFPLLNWFVFVAAGNVIGWIYRSGYAARFLRIAFPAGLVVTAVYMYLCLVAETPFTRALQSDWGYYSMHTPDALFTTVGVAPFMLGLFFLISKVIPQKWEAVLIYPSRCISQFYFLSWVWIMWTANLFLFVPKATTEAGFLLVWAAMIVLTTISVIYYNKSLYTPVNAFFCRNEKALTAAIWISLLFFGVWYFTVIPGPYTLPY